jgi:hypothetical protein
MPVNKSLIYLWYTEAFLLLQKRFTWNTNPYPQLENFFLTLQYMKKYHKQLHTDAAISRTETFIRNKTKIKICGWR